MKRLVLIVAAGCAVVPILTSSALAQPDREAVEAARTHFDRGLELFNEGRHDAALAEFSRAYEIAPAPPVLFNIARVHAALGHAVEATDTYERYLREAGDSLAAGRRREVQSDLDRQRARIARLTVRTSVEGAVISVDGVDVATAPLPEPLRLSAGEHTIGARGAGHDASRRRVRLAGGDEQTLVFELAPIVSAQGTLRIASTVPDVAVELDGRLVGRTPLNATIPASEGEHILVARRAGYRDRRIPIELEGGAERVVDLEMEADADADASAVGSLRLHLPDAPAIVHVDGRPTIPSAAGLRLPAGRHRLELEVAEREPHSTLVEVPAGQSVDVSPELTWTPEARALRVSAAERRRTTGVLLTVAGGLALIGGGTALIWNEGRIDDTDARIVQLNGQVMAMGCDRNPEAGDCPALIEEGERRASDQDAQQRAHRQRGGRRRP